ncbi:MAG: transglycosylase SLT domain-containing protein [Clostridium sp.]|nr:transglycosylase SLT domain-containing protein [Bacteroides sp.]MCM1197798.1 transglycosylase SLT domain-containing protein [Clostridium sp.]
MTGKTKSRIRRGALTLLLLPIAYHGSRFPSTEKSDIAFGDGVIRCVIETGEEMYSSNGLCAGFNYEMLKKFAETAKLPAVIMRARENASYEDSLAIGAIDILVRQSADTIRNAGIWKACDPGNDCAWYISHDRTEEFKNINIWASSIIGSKEYNTLRSRFYSIYDPFKRIERGNFSRRLSPYDALFRKHAGTIGWDWRMLAAIVYQESRFSIMAHSHRGASGLMQILPSTAMYYGIEDTFDPEQNIIAGTMHLARLQKAFQEEGFSMEEMVKFTLAAYNAGEGRIADCRHVAHLQELDSTKWDNIVQIIPDMRSYRIQDNDTIREGRFRGTETISYVRKIMDIYGAFCEICPE